MYSLPLSHLGHCKLRVTDLGQESGPDHLAMASLTGPWLQPAASQGHLQAAQLKSSLLTESKSALTSQPSSPKRGRPQQCHGWEAHT